MERIKRVAVFRVRGKNVFRLLIIFFVFGYLIVACGPEPYIKKEKPSYRGVYHLVKKGETFYSIAKAYNINMQELAEINNIINPDIIEENTVIFIPEANQVIEDVMKAAAKDESAAEKEKIVSETDKSATDKKSGRPLKQEKVKAEKTVKSKEETARQSSERKEIIHYDKKRFIWPVRGSVKTRFGIQPNKTYHNWIKIVSRKGEPVESAASGTVIFASILKDFGETVIIRHENNYATVYTHLKKIKVKVDQNIKRGETIAFVGEKDEAGDAYINFEVRLRGKARNPIFFLP